MDAPDKKARSHTGRTFIVAAIELTNVYKYFDRVPALLEANLTVNEGDFFGFVGPNGSGKSTTLRILMNYLNPSSGSARIFGMDVVKKNVQIKRLVGYVPSEVDFGMNMKAIDVIMTAAKLRHHVDMGSIGELCDLFEVEKKRSVSRMSLGNRKKIALVIALYAKPKLLLLDEATVGLDPVVHKRLCDYLREENKKGATIFFSTHNIGEVQDMCNRMALIYRGSVFEATSLTDWDTERSRRVSICTEDDLSALFSLFGVKQVFTANGYVTFYFPHPMNELIQALANYNIIDLQIGRPSLEDEIIRFYEKEEKKEVANSDAFASVNFD